MATTRDILEVLRFLCITTSLPGSISINLTELVERVEKLEKENEQLKKEVKDLKDMQQLRDSHDAKIYGIILTDLYNMVQRIEKNGM